MSTAYELTGSYGKQSVPVFKIRKDGPRHSVSDMVVQIMLEGDVAGSWEEGNNASILPTETQKNTCYAMALKTDFTCVEEYGAALGADILRRHLHLHTVRLVVEERQWDRVVVDGVPHNHVFTSGKAPVRKWCKVRVDRQGPPLVQSGVKGVKVMKTAQSGFKGFIVDEFTNLKVRVYICGEDGALVEEASEGEGMGGRSDRCRRIGDESRVARCGI
jgi:urate oxidase